MDILVTAYIWRNYEEALRRAAPDAGWFVMDTTGDISGIAGQDRLDWQDVQPEIAFGSYDLFETSGAPADAAMSRKFFGFVRQCNSLRWFQSPAAGFENPFFAEVLARGIRFTTGHGTAPAISEYVIRSVLDAFQNADRWRAAQAQSHWDRSGPRFREVGGSTWIVLGLGAIGAGVASRARALGATVVGVRRSARGDEPVDRLVGPDDWLDEVNHADVVVSCLPLNASTHGFIGSACFERMHTETVLVNIGRGDVIDTEALLRSLDQRRVPGRAVLDVTSPEPLPADSPLWLHPQVTITPHTSGYSRSTNDRLVEQFTAELERYVAGLPLRHERLPES